MSESGGYRERTANFSESKSDIEDSSESVTSGCDQKDAFDVNLVFQIDLNNEMMLYGERFNVNNPIITTNYV